MKIVKFLGGLGNQMFQYAFYKALVQQFGNVKADLSGFESYNLHNGFELERVFNLRLNRASKLNINLLDDQNRQWKYRKLRRLLFIKPSYFEEKMLFAYDNSLFLDKAPKLYWGYWQNHRYLEPVADELRTDFIFPPLGSSQNKELLKELEQEEESVAIHVRRGDYLKDPYLGGLVNLSYFEQGISLMRKRLKNLKFYIFSDDIPWCKKNLSLDLATFVDWNKGAESYRDMQLISNCKHAIISNSSFSWWGAWLNQNPNKVVVVPKVWYKSPDACDTAQMHPQGWIKL